MIRAPRRSPADTSAQISSSAGAHRRAAALDVVEAADDVRRDSPGRSPSRLMWRILASSSLSMTGNGSTSWRHERRRRLEQVGLRADGAVPSEVTSSSRIASSGGLVTWANSCGEVVEQQPRPVATAPRSGVSVPIEPIGSPPRPGHRGEQDAQLLLGVAEDLLAPGDRGVRVHDVLALGEVARGGCSPACSHSSYGCSAASCGLDLLVLDDPALLGVDEEHPAGLEPALAGRPWPGRCRARRPRRRGRRGRRR